MAETGDQVILSDLSGRKVTYSIYNKYKVDPTDVSCTSQLTNGKRELTLITCTNYGQERLVLKAREV
jgi:LPXTG-site transpeptidase (sortase) family protein